MRWRTPLRTPAPSWLGACSPYAACAPSQVCPTVSSSPFTWARESATKEDPTSPKGQQCHDCPLARGPPPPLFGKRIPLKDTDLYGLGTPDRPTLG